MEKEGYNKEKEVEEENAYWDKRKAEYELSKQELEREDK